MVEAVSLSLSQIVFPIFLPSPSLPPSLHLRFVFPSCNLPIGGIHGAASDSGSVHKMAWLKNNHSEIAHLVQLFETRFDMQLAVKHCSNPAQRLLVFDLILSMVEA